MSDEAGNRRRERMLGGLLGVAVGDALGATVEFMPREQVRRQFGLHREMTGGGWLELQPGEWTDDTGMTLAVAEGILAEPANPIGHIGLCFLGWYHSAPRDVGTTIRAALDAYLRNVRTGSPAPVAWTAAAVTAARGLGGKTAGNGSLMRVLPVALAYHRYPEIMAQAAAGQSRLTHWDTQAEAACVLYCHLAAALLTGPEERSAVEAALAAALAKTKSRYSADDLPPEFWQRLQSVAKLNYGQLNGSGYVLDTLEAALWCLLNSDTFEQCVVQAVNLGDDADTVGAVAGGLAGCRWGAGAIPSRWLEPLAERGRVEELAGQLADLQLT